MNNYAILKIPRAHEDELSCLRPSEKTFLDLVILGVNAKAEICYQMAHPSLKQTIKWMKTRALATMNSQDGKEYIAQRKKQLAVHFSSSQSPVSEEDKESEKFVIDENFMDKVYGKMVQAIDDPDSDLHNDAMKLGFKKAMDEVASEKEFIDPPIRYLPESCRFCRYKLFVENDCNDECKACNYKKYANKNGVFYNHKEQLDEGIDV